MFETVDLTDRSESLDFVEMPDDPEHMEGAGAAGIVRLMGGCSSLQKAMSSRTGM
ncbi:hypothetical protein BT69DRAFT_1277973 [Atractiella rhizophila]|nr:hypothetical protein BT69DRAFT_1277973 [Atractiella rhizophila]